MHLIRHLSRTQSGGHRFQKGHISVSPTTTHVLITIGPSKVLNEPKCGSGAHIPTHVCKNFIPNSALESANRVLLSPSTVDIVLSASGLEGCRTSRLDTPEETTTPPATLPRFGTRTAPKCTKASGSRPQPGLIYNQGTLTTPSPDVREAITGFTPGDTAALGLTTQ